MGKRQLAGLDGGLRLSASTIYLEFAGVSAVKFRLKAAGVLLGVLLPLQGWAACRLPPEDLVFVTPSALHLVDRLLRKCFEDYFVVWSPVTLAPAVTLEKLEPQRIR